MENKNTLDSIIKELDTGEKQDLLNKIIKPEEKDESESKDEQERLTPSQKQASQLKIARNEYNNYSWLNKMIIKIISLMKGKKTEEIVLENIIISIKKEIISRYGNIIDFDRNTFTSEFIKELAPLARISSELSNFFSRYIKNDIVNFTGFIFESSLPDEKRKFLNSTNPESITYNKEMSDKNLFNKERDKRLREYFNSIDRNNYVTLSDQIDKLEILFKIIFFDYQSLFKCFYLSDISEKISSTNFSEYHRVEKDLERLFKYMFYINFRFGDIDFILSYPEFLRSESTQEKEIPSPDDIKKISNVFSAIDILSKKIPFLQIFRYFKNNIQYTPAKAPSSQNFMINYKNYKKQQLTLQWDNYYKKMREKYLSDLIEELIGFYEYTTLPNFTPSLKSQLEKYSTIKLNNIYMLNLSAEFLNRIYKKKIEPVINSLLVNGNFKNEGSKVLLSNAYFELENAYKGIIEYDESFSENNSQGKKLVTFIKLVGTDAKYAKTLQNKVLEINSKTNEIAKAVSNPMKNMYDVLIRILDVNNPVMCPVSNVDSIRFSGYLANPIKAIEDSVKLFNMYYEILNNFDENKK